MRHETLFSIFVKSFVFLIPKFLSLLIFLCTKPFAFFIIPYISILLQSRYFYSNFGRFQIFKKRYTLELEDIFCEFTGLNDKQMRADFSASFYIKVQTRDSFFFCCCEKLYACLVVSLFKLTIKHPSYYRVNRKKFLSSCYFFSRNDKLKKSDKYAN